MYYLELLNENKNLLTFKTEDEFNSFLSLNGYKLLSNVKCDYDTSKIIDWFSEYKPYFYAKGMEFVNFAVKIEDDGRLSITGYIYKMPCDK